MPKQTVDCLVEGGKASAGPPIGSSLGPLGVNVGQVVQDINSKTASFKGMQVPVKIDVDTDTKEYTISIGTPPASALIKQEAGIKKGAGNPLTDKVADLKIEQVIKVAIQKEDNLLGKDLKQKIKEIIGTCQSMGILVEGVPAHDAVGRVNNGEFDEKIKTRKTELSVEELKEQEEEKKRLAEEMEKRKEEFTAKAKAILAEMAGKEKKEIKARMVEEGIPTPMIAEFVPEEEAPKEGEEPKEGEASKPGEEKKEEPKEEKK